MSKATIAGIILAVLIGTIGGLALMAVDGMRRLLATDRDWTLAPRFPDGPDGCPNIDPLGWP